MHAGVPELAANLFGGNASVLIDGAFGVALQADRSSSTSLSALPKTTGGQTNGTSADTKSVGSVYAAPSLFVVLTALGVVLQLLL
jgi:hypothetical protein